MLDHYVDDPASVLHNMEKVNFSGKSSLKNIPIPTKQKYLKKLVSKTESFLRRLRWRASFLLKYNENLNPDREPVKNYGFKSDYAPPHIKDIEAFEKDLVSLIKNVEFWENSNSNEFLRDLSNNIKNMKNLNEVIVSADKTRNLYKVDKQDYQKLLKENITKEYQKSSETALEQTNYKASKIACDLGLGNRMVIYTKPDCFITIKDHKESFTKGRIECRLINPAKTNIGRVAKIILQNINEGIRKVKCVNQWRNTATVIDWFKALKNKNCLKFIKFDIVAFYPSITPELLNKSINFAKSIVRLTEEEENILKHARMSFLFLGGEPWIKKGTNGNFDVPMGSYDGAEVCELVGLYLLNKLTAGSAPFNRGELGLYRDDGLAVRRGSG